jgi:hypothetical protein
MWVPGIFLGVKGGKRIRLTTSPLLANFLKKCENLHMLKPYGPPEPVAGIIN